MQRLRQMVRSACKSTHHKKIILFIACPEGYKMPNVPLIFNFSFDKFYEVINPIYSDNVSS